MRSGRVQEVVARGGSTVFLKRLLSVIFLFLSFPSGTFIEHTMKRANVHPLVGLTRVPV